MAIVMLKKKYLKIYLIYGKQSYFLPRILKAKKKPHTPHPSSAQKKLKANRAM